MTIVSIKKKKFEEEIGKLDEKMKSKIAMFGTPIEKDDSEELDIEVFPNRPDLLSYSGFKRGFLAFLSKKVGLQQYKVNKPEENYKVIIDSSVKDVRPYTVCAIVRGLDLNDEKIKEIIDIQERLHLTIGRKRKKVAIGIYPLDKIQLPITFKALEPDKIKFIPLEYDKELSGLEVLQRHPTGKEYAHLLAGKIKFPVFVDAKEQILSMPPIINSHITGHVDPHTKDVFIECSGFDQNSLKNCLNIITTCLADMGGKIFQMEISRGLRGKEITPDFTPRLMKLSLEKVKKLLGLELSEKQIKDLLERMSYNYKNKIAEVPAWRADILHEVDLIEDIAIAYGYENFIPEIPEIATIGAENTREKIKKNIAIILSGLGFLETSSYHLTKKENQLEKLGLLERPLIEVENSKTEFAALRENLTSMLLKTLGENIDSEYPQKIFELGSVFIESGGKITEKESLALSIAPGNFTEAKQDLEYLFKMLSLDLTFSEPKNFPPWFIDGRVAEIFLQGKKLGFIGEIHPKILGNWGIKMPVALFEVSLNEILTSLSSL